jgi:hypothetical protein
MTPDSFDVWGQVKSHEFSNRNTVGYSLFFIVTTLGGKYHLLTSLFQLLLIVFAIFTLFKSLMPHNSNMTNRWLTLSILLIPQISSVSLTLWKDVPFTAFLLLGVCHFSNALTTKRNSIMFLGLSELVIACIFRHDGWLTLMFIALIFGLVSIKAKKNANLKYVSLILITSVLGFLFSVALPKSVSADPVPRWFQLSTLAHDLVYAYSSSEGSLSPQTQTLIRDLAGPLSIEGSRNCSTINGLVFSPDFNKEVVDARYRELIRSWFKEASGPAAPFMYEARFCRVKNFLPPLISSQPTYAYWIANGIDEPNAYNLRSGDFFEPIRFVGKFWTAIWMTNHAQLGWPGLHSLLVVLCCVYFWQRSNKNQIYLMLFSMTIARSLVMVAISTAGDFRYALMIHVVSACLVINFAFKKLKTI